MKKLICTAAAILLLLGLAGCGAGSNANTGNTANVPANNTAVPTNNTAQPAEKTIFGTQIAEGVYQLDHIKGASEAHISGGVLYADFAKYTEEYPDGYLDDEYPDIEDGTEDGEEPYEEPHEEFEGEYNGEGDYPEYDPEYDPEYGGMILESLSLNSYDIYTGEQLASRSFDDDFTVYFRYFNDGTLAAISYRYGNRYTLLSADLSESLGEYYWDVGSYYSSPQCYKNAAYYMEGNNLYAVDLGTMKTTLLAEDLPNGSYLTGCDDSYVYLNTVINDSQKVIRLRLANQELKIFGGYESYNMRYANDHIYYCRYGYSNVLKLDEDQDIFLENGFDGESVQTVSRDYILTQEYHWSDEKGTYGKKIRAYRLSDGELMFDSSRSGLSLIDDYNFIEVESIWEDGNLLLLRCVKDDMFEKESYGSEADYYIIDTSSWAPIEKKLHPALDPETYEAELEEEYGVEIICGPEVTLYPGGDYYVEEVENEYETGKALYIMGETLAKFPEGFFKEYCSPMTEGGIPNSIKFYITGDIHGPEYSTSSIAALTTPVYDEDAINSHIALDASYSGSFEQNIAHELWHAIEDRLFKTSEYFGDYTEQWIKFLPRGVNYNYGYRGNDGDDYQNTKYTPSEPVKGEAYFIDSYSRTWPHEDRARIFEYMFLAGDNESYDTMPWNFRYKGIYDKGFYLCSILRDNFESVRNCELPHWERVYVLTEDITENLW